MKFFLPFAFLILSFQAGAQSNNSLYFDSDARVTGLSGISPAQFTIEFWMLLNHAGNQYQGIYWSANGTDERGIYVEQNNTISLWSQGILQYNSATPLVLNQWSHIAFTYNASQLRIYINGVLTNTLTISGLLIPTTAVTMGFGSGVYGNYNMANSALDEFRIWNVARSQANILATKDMQLTLPQTGLVRYYNFNQGVGGGNNAGVTTLVDQTGNSAGGTLAGFTLMGNLSNWVSNVPPITTLPLKLLSFAGYLSGNNIRLKWITSEEMNVQKFEIEKSSPGGVLQKVAELPARNNASNTNIYEWSDPGPFFTGNNLYRLKMVDIDTKFNYSNVINVQTGKVTTELKIFYLPGSSKTYGLQLPETAPKGNYSLKIYNMAGMQLHQEELIHSSYSTIQPFILPSFVAAGIYTIVLNNGKYVISEKLIVR